MGAVDSGGMSRNAAPNLAFRGFCFDIGEINVSNMRFIFIFGYRWKLLPQPIYFMLKFVKRFEFDLKIIDRLQHLASLISKRASLDCFVLNVCELMQESHRFDRKALKKLFAHWLEFAPEMKHFSKLSFNCQKLTFQSQRNISLALFTDVYWLLQAENCSGRKIHP